MSNSLLSLPKLFCQEGTPTAQIREHQVYSHALNSGLPPSEKLPQTPNPPQPPKRWDHQWNLLFRAEWQRAGRCHLQGSKASRESPPAHKVSAAPNCSWSCHGKTTIPWLQWHCAASKSSHSKPVGYSVAAPPSLLKLLLSQSKN